MNDAPNDEVRQWPDVVSGPFGVHRMVALTALGRGAADLSYQTRAPSARRSAAAREACTVKDW